MCFHKIVFTTELKAQKAAVRNTRDSKVNFYHYQCPVCSFWHITRKPREVEIKKVEPASLCPTTKKIQYKTFEEAKKSEPSKNYFKCKFCNKWHTTKTVSL